LEELLRVSAIMVIITVPNDSIQDTQNSIDENQRHINSFSSGDFEYLKSRVFKIIHKRMVSKLLLILAVIAEASPRDYLKTALIPRFFVDIYNKLLSLWKVLTGKRLMAALITIDSIVCKLIPFYRSHQFVIYKRDESVLKNQKINNISAKQIIDYKVSYFRLDQKSN